MKQNDRLKELAMKVDWTPLYEGGTSYKSVNLNQTSKSRLETSQSIGLTLFGSTFAITGLGSLLIVSYFVYQESGFSLELLNPVLFGSLFTATGYFLLNCTNPKVFDLKLGWFWSGKKLINCEQELMKLKESVRISSVAAIQIVSELVDGPKGRTYASWEINLIANDGQRFNVLDNEDKASILHDAQLISEFLGVPVWENT